MAKHFKSKRKLRKRWIMEYGALLLFTYFLIKLCIYSLVDISPASYLEIETIGKNFYTKVKNSTINNPIFLLNYKGEMKPKKNFISTLPVVDMNPEQPRIYIYNTHQKEGYQTKETVFNASYELKKEFEKQNISVTVEEGDIQEFLTANNYSYNYSYIASRYFVKGELEKNVYDLIIDLHRDAISKKSSTVTIEGKEYAKILFVVGKEHDNYERNYKLAQNLNEKISSKYPGLTRGVLLREGKNVNGIYNQDLSANMILLELGGNYNTYEEVKNTIALIAPMIGEYIYGQKV